jgi:hypothetical protein
MRRILERKIAAVFLVASLAFLASCANPEPSATADVQQHADLCRKYERPTDFGRCRLFLSAEGWRFIPEIGRNADLDTQIRCAPFRPDLRAYAECIGEASAVAAAPDAGAMERGAGLTNRAPVREEPIAPHVAAVRPGRAYNSGSIEELDPSWTNRTSPRSHALSRRRLP